MNIYIVDKDSGEPQATIGAAIILFTLIVLIVVIMAQALTIVELKQSIIEGAVTVNEQVYLIQEK